jgi:hypothetical protein
VYRIRRGAEETEPFVSDRPLQVDDILRLDDGQYRVIAVEPSTGTLITIDVEPIEAQPA